MLTLLRTISLRHLIRAPARSAMVVLGIALGIAMFAATQATNHSILAAFEEMVQRVAGKADLSVVSDGGGVPMDRVSELRDIEGVEHAAATLEETTRVGDDQGALLVLGVDLLGDLHFLPFDVEQGDEGVIDDPLVFINDPHAILISRTLADRLDIGPGDEISLLTSHGMQPFHVRGVLDDSGPAASFGGQVAVMFLDAAQVAFSRDRLVDRIDVDVADDAEHEVVRKRIEAALGPALRVQRPERVGSRLYELISPIRGALDYGGLIALLVGMFLIYNAIAIAIVQRRNEIGVLRALGVTRGRTVVFFCLEALLLAVPGVALGLWLGQKLAVFSLEQMARTVNSLFVAVEPPVPQVSLRLASMAAGAGILMTLVAAYWPARKASHVEPVETLRSARRASSASDVPYRKLLAAAGGVWIAAWITAQFQGTVTGAAATGLLVIGTALAAPAVVVALRALSVGALRAWLSVPGRLAMDNVERALGRSALNVLALLVAVSMSIMAGTWLRSLERSLDRWMEQAAAGDVIVTAGSPLLDRRSVPFSEDVLDKMQGLDGVRSVQPVRIIDQRVGDKEVQVQAKDMQVYLEELHRKGGGWQVVDGETPIEPGALTAKPQVVLSENAAHKLGLGAGDTVELRGHEGSQRFRVRAVVVDYSSTQGTIFVDRTTFAEHWNEPAIDAVQLYLKPGAETQLVIDAARERLGGGPGLFVTSTHEIKSRIRNMTRQSFAYARSVELITLLIALLGVIGTMLAAVMDRTREIGVLRAVGASRGQIVRTIVIEAAFLGLCAVVAGVGGGIPQGMVFLETLVFEETGWRLDYMFPTFTALRIGVLVVITAAIAGVPPAFRAARLEPRDALNYE